MKLEDHPEFIEITETALQLQIIKYLRWKGHACGKTKTVGVYDKKIRCRRKDPYLFSGFPDLTAFVPNLVFIEVKKRTGRQSLEQKMFEELCREAGIPYILARRLEDVMEIVK